MTRAKCRHGAGWVYIVGKEEAQSSSTLDSQPQVHVTCGACNAADNKISADEDAGKDLASVRLRLQWRNKPGNDVYLSLEVDNAHAAQFELEYLLQPFQDHTSGGKTMLYDASPSGVPLTRLKCQLIMDQVQRQLALKQQKHQQWRLMGSAGGAETNAAAAAARAAAAAANQAAAAANAAAAAAAAATAAVAAAGEPSVQRSLPSNTSDRKPEQEEHQSQRQQELLRRRRRRQQQQECLSSGSIPCHSTAGGYRQT